MTTTQVARTSRFTFIQLFNKGLALRQIKRSKRVILGALRIGRDRLDNLYCLLLD